MAAATVRKLIVEVVEAHDLLPKDGTGTSSPYVVVDFDGQRRKTQTALRVLNPTWNEALEFSVIGPLDEAGEPVEVDVYHDRKVGPSRRNNFLGRVRLNSRQIVKKGEEALIYFPLEKKSFFGWVRGEIGLKVYYVDEPIPEPAPEPPAEAAEKTEAPAQAPPEGGDGNAEKADAPAAVAEPAPEAGKTESSSEVIPPPAPPEEAIAQAEMNGEKPTESDPLPPPVAECAPEASEANPPPVPEPSSDASPPPDVVVKESTPKWLPQPRQMPAPRDRAPEVVERSKYDLVDKMQYLFIRVVRARSLPGNAKPHVRVSAYGRRVSTQPARRPLAAVFEWNETFAFARDAANAGDASSPLEISVWNLPPESDVSDATGEEKHFLGGVCFDVSEVPVRDPPDSPLAPQWYRLEGGAIGGSHRRGGDLMLATWVGTQADESFADAWKADAPSSHAASRPKVYLSPKLWYLRLTVIEAHDTVTPPSTAISIKATLGFQMLRTRSAVSRSGSPSWNEDLLFVTAEPLGDDQRLLLSLESRQNKDTVVLGGAAISLSTVERRVDDRKVASRWLDLAPVAAADDNTPPSKKGAQRSGGRLHVRVCLDGGYHVSDELPQACSDYRPSARQLWRPPVGALELGIVGCKGLLPTRTVDGKGTTSAFTVAKYGPKWARTRTAADSFDPAWNEQYTWPVYDPCTVLTVAVFDESDGTKDSTCRFVGKVRIRISTLETNRSYRGSYPLVSLLPSGVKRMGEIELAVRFSRAGSLLDLLHTYSQPMLPTMHHLRPIPPAHREPLRLAAVRIVTAHLARSEPSLRREVAMWVLDAAEPRGFSMRKVRANWNRIVSALSWVADAAKWLEDVRAWRSPSTTMLAHGVLVLLVWYPELTAPTAAVHAAAVGAWRYRRRARGPAPHPCVRTSQAEVVDRDELDEEFDPVPSSKGAEVVRARYDRMRGVATRFQAMLGDVAAQAERVQALVTWRDPRATGMFVALCFLVGLLLYLVPMRIAVVAAGFYYLRHPMFRDRMPPPAINFFRRLPSLADRVI